MKTLANQNPPKPFDECAAIFGPYEAIREKLFQAFQLLYLMKKRFLALYYCYMTILP